MSEEPARFEFAQHVTPDEFSAYFADKGIVDKCERCGRDSWVIITDDELAGLALPAGRQAGGSDLGRNFMAYMLCCNHCANIWLMSRMAVDIWVKERRGKTNG